MYWWRILNKAIFDDVLLPPENIIIERNNDSWGRCEGKRTYSKHDPVTIYISDEIDEREFLIEILAHEMVHQWEQQIYGRMYHGKVFQSWLPKLKELKIQLEKWY